MRTVRVSEFDFAVVHRRGHKNQAVHALAQLKESFDKTMLHAHFPELVLSKTLHTVRKAMNSIADHPTSTVYVKTATASKSHRTL